MQTIEQTGKDMKGGLLIGCGLSSLGMILMCSGTPEEVVSGSVAVVEVLMLGLGFRFIGWRKYG